ncbi:hypothetical protein DV113_000134 [Geotrichum candidum]|nr:hypothetical protein DV113_000134 [Geotrichum candidum]
MVSSLASQLAAINAGNTQVIDRKKRKQIHSVSLIFTPKVAAGQDYETIYSVAIEGLTDLEQLDPRFAAFRNNIFADTSISVDRLTQTTVKNPSKNLIIRALGGDYELHRLVASYIVKVIKGGFDYQLLLTFWSSMSIWVILHLKEKNVAQEDIVDRFLSDLSDVIRLKKRSEAQIAAYMIFSVIGSQFQLSADVSNAAIQSIALNWSASSQKSGLAAITQIVKGRDEEPASFDATTYKILKKNNTITEDVVSISESYNIHRFVTIWALSLLKYSAEDLSQLVTILTNIEVTDSELELILKQIIAVATTPKTLQSTRAQLTAILEHILISEKKELIFKAALEAADVSFEALELALQSSLNTRILGKSESVDTDANLFKPVASKAELKTEIRSLEEITIVSFFSVDSTDAFIERANIFSQLVPFKSLEEVLKHIVINENQAVSFLARVWCGIFPSLVRADAIKIFIEIVSKNSATTDYQGLVGPLLVALSDSSERVRRLAVTALNEVQKSYSNKKLAIWGIKDVFKSSETFGDVTWVASAKVSQFIDLVNANSGEFIVSAHSIFPFISTFLTSPEKSAKTASSQIYTSLASMATFIQTFAIKLGLLKLLNQYNKSNRSSYLETLLNTWLKARGDIKSICDSTKAPFDDLESEVIDIITTGERGNGIAFLKSCIKSGDAAIAEKASNKIISIWESLRPETMLDLFNFLVDFAIDGQNTFDPTEVLFSVTIPTSIFVSVLENCKLDNSTNGSAGIPKRRRRSSGTTKQKLQTGDLADIAERHLKKTTLILESLERNSNEGNVQLLSQLFVILDEILTLGTDSSLPINYTEQVLANCMINIVGELKKQKNLKLDSNSMRVDILVSCIRSSSSQQVQNRFLLLVANLASLDSDIVLHSVMPIFTFMGANTIRQDDEFSAHVIQQTITQVIPALLSNQKESNVGDVDFLLLSFVAAFAHIPRHRRVRLFSTLVKTLGSSSALHSLIFLLGQKYFEAKQKRKSVDAKSLLQFAESFFRSFTVSEQFLTIRNFLDLINLIPVHELTEEERETGSPFTQRQIFNSIVGYSTSNLLSLRSTLIQYLASIITNENIISDIPSLRVSTAVLFKEASAEQEAVNDISVQIIKNTLQTLSDLRKKEEKDSLAPVINSYHLILDSFLELLPINIFVHVFQNILLVSDNEKTRQQSVSLLRSKFELESASDEDAKAAALTAFSVLVELVSQDLSKAIVQQAFNSLEVVILKLGNDFEPKQLLKLLDLVVGTRGLLNDDVEIVVSSVSVISSIFSVLGARAIGYFGKVIPVLFKKFEESLPKGDEEQDEETKENSELIQLATFGLVAGLVKRIPAFMNSSLVSIFKLIFLSTVSVATRQTLIENVAGSMDAKAVLQALTETWTYAVKSGWSAIALHLDSVDNVVASSDRKTVSSQSANLVTFLLKSFEVRGLSEKYDQNTIHRIETRTIKTGIQIVMKLNDKTFRPLFVRMVRWAIEGEGSSGALSEVARKTVFFKYLTKLFGSLKSIITSYFSYLVDPVCNILEPFYAEGAKEISKDDASLRVSVLNTLIVSFQYDREEFWQAQARFDKIVAALIEQIPTIDANHGNTLVKSIVGLAETVSSPEQYKVINDKVLAHMQESCSVSEKIWAVRTMKALFGKLGEEWVTMLPQLVPVLAELLEDDDESVEIEVRKNLVPVVEEVLGESLDRYLA